MRSSKSLLHHVSEFSCRRTEATLRRRAVQQQVEKILTSAGRRQNLHPLEMKKGICVMGNRRVSAFRIICFGVMSQLAFTAFLRRPISFSLVLICRFPTFWHLNNRWRQKNIHGWKYTSFQMWNNYESDDTSSPKKAFCETISRSVQHSSHGTATPSATEERRWVHLHIVSGGKQYWNIFELWPHQSRMFMNTHSQHCTSSPTTKG